MMAMRMTLLLVSALWMGLYSILPEEGASPRKAQIRGQITNIKRAASPQGQSLMGTILVEGAKGETEVDQAQIRITSETRIFERKGEERSPASFEALRIEEQVEVRFAGPILETYPVQATAAEVVILTER